MNQLINWIVRQHNLVYAMEVINEKNPGENDGQMTMENHGKAAMFDHILLNGAHGCHGLINTMANHS